MSTDWRPPPGRSACYDARVGFHTVSNATPTATPIHSGLAVTANPVGQREPLEPLPFPLETRHSPEKPRLCVVIPAFNEEDVLGQTSRALTSSLDALDVDWSVVIVNDGSRDMSARVLEQLHRADQRFGYLLLSRNFGHQAALTAGLDHAEGDVIVTMDADLQHPPELLRSLLDAWREGFDVVHTRKVDTVGLSGWRRMVTPIAYSFIQRVAGIRIIPQASDYRLLDASALDALRSLPEVARLYRGLTSWVGFRQCVLPYVAAERAGGRSQYSLRQLLTLGARSLFDFSDIFLHAGLVVGSLGLLLSAVYLTFILAWVLFGRSTPPGWVSSMSVTIVMDSILFFFLGILGVYVARIYREVRRRPAYIVSRARRARNEGETTR
jgi:glycosyltransferase involved in cell wall biosynthesis